MMTRNDQPRFFQALTAMAEIFQDEMTELRQKLYWQLFADRNTIDEWEYACEQAMVRETFHKVPLPAQLLDYIREYRQEQAREQRYIAETQRLTLEVSPEWKAEQREQERQRAEQEHQRQKEYQQWSASLSYEDKILFRIINPPRDGSQPYRRLTEEELLYTPYADPAEAKRKAREQLQQIMAESHQEEDDQV